jgi:hypothetical protein
MEDKRVRVISPLNKAVEEDKLSRLKRSGIRPDSDNATDGARTYDERLRVGIRFVATVNSVCVGQDSS